MSDHELGQVDTSAARVYDGLFVPALFGRFAAPIADMAEVAPDRSALDVACGTGALTRELADRTSGRVVGVDINPGMLSVAAGHGGDVDYQQGDALVLAFDDEEFDVATCQFGIMFYPDPSAGVTEMARVAARGLVAVWDSIGTSDGYLAMQELFRSELGDDAAASLDAPFSMGAEGVLEGIVADAGVEGASFVSVPGSGGFRSIEEWVTTEVRGWTLGDSVDDAQLAALVARAEVDLVEFATDDGCEFTMTAKIASW